MIALLVAAVLAAAPAPPAPSIVFISNDYRINEASGIARGIASPGILYVQNDGGDSARVFALDARTGLARAVIYVPGAVNHDWEDIAVAPDAHGTPSLWIADTGDNNTNRAEVQLYRIDEPKVDMSSRDATIEAGRPDVWRLRYPSGPADVESLAVSPQGRAYLVTKTATGPSQVFAVPPDPSRTRVQLVRRIGQIKIRPTIGGSLIPRRLQLLTTGAALSRDGSILAVRTYLQAYVWHVRHGDIAAGLRTRPAVVALPLERQGEGICIDGDSLVVDSEGRRQPVWRVALPAGFVPVPRPAPSSAAPATAPARVTPTPPASASPRPAWSRQVVLGVGGTALVLAALAAGGLGAWRVTRKRRRRG